MEKKPQNATPAVTSWEEAFRYLTVKSDQSIPEAIRFWRRRIASEHSDKLRNRWKEETQRGINRSLKDGQSE